MNITGLQFFGRDDPAVDEFFAPNLLPIQPPLKANERSLRVGDEKRLLKFSLFHPQASAALIYDSVYFFARALRQFVEKHPFHVTPLACDAQKPWIHGAAFALFLKRVDRLLLHVPKRSLIIVLLLV